MSPCLLFHLAIDSFFLQENKQSLGVFFILFFLFDYGIVLFYLIVVKAIVDSEVMTYIDFFFFFWIAVVIVRWLENFTRVRNRQTIDLRIYHKYTDDKKE